MFEIQWFRIGVVACLCGLSAGAAVSQDFTIENEPRLETVVSFQGREVAVYHTGEALDKSYFHPLLTPDRLCVTYDAPADHLHHRGLCVGWPDVSGVDFWAEINAPQGKRGKIVTQSVSGSPLPSGAFSLVEQNSWQAEDGGELVQGMYVWNFYPPVDNRQIIDVELTLTAMDDVVFGSDAGAPRAYHGLTVRIGPFAQVEYFNANGSRGGEKCRGESARWCAVSGSQNGKPALIAFLDHPANGQRPTRFYIQDQGMQFMSTSPNTDAAKPLKEGEQWHLYYRVVAAGKQEQNVSRLLDTLWDEFAQKPFNSEEFD